MVRKVLAFRYPWTIKRDPLSAIFMCTEFYHINIHLNRKTTTYLILSKKQRFIWVALAVKPHLINWISVFHSIVKSDHLGKEKVILPWELLLQRETYKIGFFETKVLLLLNMNTSFGGILSALLWNGKKLLRSHPFPISFFAKSLPC